MEIEIGWPHRPRRSVRQRVGVAAGVGDAPGRDTRRRLGRVPRPVLRLTKVVHFYRCCAKGRGGAVTCWPKNLTMKNIYLYAISKLNIYVHTFVMTEKHVVRDRERKNT